MRIRAGVAAASVALLALLAPLAACSTASSAAGRDAGGPVRVVAVENFWGSIAAQLGGAHAVVESIIDRPNADPHDYEPTTADGRAIATADLVVINGIGYDTWATKLAAANPDPAQTVLTVGELVGAKEGDNPHRWYDPRDVQKVVDEITADYQRIDPTHAAYFTGQRAAFETTAMAPYKAVAAQIRQAYAGTAVGASESIFAMVAPSLGLDLLTPPTFLRAISQGTDPTAADKATIDAQIKGHVIKVYVYNRQNATPDVQAQIAEAEQEGIPVTTITETMPAGTSTAPMTWQRWQTAQLVALRDALVAAAR